VRPVLEAGGGRSHGWSRMVGGGQQGMRVDNLEEGGRRLAACAPLADPDQKGKQPSVLDSRGESNVCGFTT